MYRRKFDDRMRSPLFLQTTDYCVKRKPCTSIFLYVNLLMLTALWRCRVYVTVGCPSVRPSRRHSSRLSIHKCAEIILNNTIHRESKKQDIKLLPITSPNMNRFSNFFTDELSSKFKRNSCLNIPPRLKHVATLPCEIWKSEKWHQSEICIVSNDKSQDSIAKHLRNDELLYYTSVIQSAGERIFKIG